MKEGFLQEGNEVSVTKTQIITRRATLSLADVASVETSYQPPKKLVAYFLLWAGGLLSLYLLSLRAHARSGDYYFGVALFLGLLGLVLFFFGIRALKKAKSIYTAVLTTSLGEKETISSEDPQLIMRVVEAFEGALDAQEAAD